MILVDEIIPLMCVRRMQDMGHEVADSITRRIIEAMGLVSADQWPGLLVVMRDRAMSRWRASGP